MAGRQVNYKQLWGSPSKTGPFLLFAQGTLGSPSTINNLWKMQPGGGGGGSGCGGGGGR